MVDFSRVAFWVSVVLGVYVVIFHIGAFVLESFLLDTAVGEQLLGGKPDALAIKLGVNQGVYNLVLAGQMVAALALHADSKLRLAVHLSVFVVGLAGGITVSGTIAAIQMTPGLLGTIATALEMVLKRRAQAEPERL